MAIVNVLATKKPYPITAFSLIADFHASANKLIESQLKLKITKDDHNDIKKELNSWLVETAALADFVLPPVPEAGARVVQAPEEILGHLADFGNTALQHRNQFFFMEPFRPEEVDLQTDSPVTFRVLCGVVETVEGNKEMFFMLETRDELSMASLEASSHYTAFLLVGGDEVLVVNSNASTDHQLIFTSIKNMLRAVTHDETYRASGSVLGSQHDPFELDFFGQEQSNSNKTEHRRVTLCESVQPIAPNCTVGVDGDSVALDVPESTLTKVVEKVNIPSTADLETARNMSTDHAQEGFKNWQTKETHGKPIVVPKLMLTMAAHAEEMWAAILARMSIVPPRLRRTPENMQFVMNLDSGLVVVVHLLREKMEAAKQGSEITFDDIKPLYEAIEIAYEKVEEIYKPQ